ncbi:MAG: 1-deoxy-D-xylulose-5-phosphate reductoisomerase, partial [Bacteroidota bacterium]|nr:1-deoxy-D-xylulose-5-phosphate reductoisomerase [Bacteroidota bacterium]
TLTFFDPDLERFRNLALAYHALKMGGNMPCIMNAANEVAVNAFLAGKIGFLQMSDLVEYTMEKTEYLASPGLGFLETTNNMAKGIASDNIKKFIKKR